MQGQQNLFTAQHLFHGNLKIHGLEYPFQEFPGCFCRFVLFFFREGEFFSFPATGLCFRLCFRSLFGFRRFLRSQFDFCFRFLFFRSGNQTYMPFFPRFTGRTSPYLFTRKYGFCHRCRLFLRRICLYRIFFLMNLVLLRFFHVMEGFTDYACRFFGNISGSCQVRHRNFNYCRLFAQ